MKRQLTAVSLVMMMGVACGEGVEQPSIPVCNEAPELTPPLADMVVIDEARVTRQGCGYSIKVLQEVTPYPYPPFHVHRIIVQSEVVSPGTCTLVPRTVELATSGIEPQIAIEANAEGVVVAYAYGEYSRWFRGHDLGIQRLDPNTLCALRVAGLATYFAPGDGSLAGLPGDLSLENLSLRSSYIEASGTFTGNSIYESPRTVAPYPIVEGSHFVAIYPDFFGTTQRPPFLVTF